MAHTPHRSPRGGRAWLVLVAAFVGIPLVLGLGLLSRLEESDRREALRGELQTIREILTQTAVRGDLADSFTVLFDRLTHLAWQPRSFAARAADLILANQDLLDVYLFDPLGKRVSIPGRPDTLIFASQQFLKAVTDEKVTVPPKIIAGFAGNPDAARLMSRSPGILVDLLNGDRRTWGGWWQLRDRAGTLTGQVIAFVHRGATSPEAMLDRAVTRTQSQVGTRFLVGWLDPREPRLLHPAGATFPAELPAFLASASPSLPTVWKGEVPVVVHPTREGFLLVGLSRQTPATPVIYDAWRKGSLLAAILGMVLAFALSPLKSIRTRLILQLLIGGGVPLAVFLATVQIDRENREALMVERFKDAHLTRLMQIDQESESEYLPLLRRYRAGARALSALPLQKAETVLGPMANWAREQQGLVTSLTLVGKRGQELFSRNFLAGAGAPTAKKSRDMLRRVWGNILSYCNGDEKEGGDESAEGVLAGMVADSQKPYEWFEDRGQLTRNQLTRDAMLTFFDLLPEPGNTFRAIFFGVHDARIGQVRYLRRLTRTRIPRDSDEPRLAAIPLTPSGDWPAFPRERTGRLHVLRQLRDLAVSTGLPQHAVTRIGNDRFLVSAVRGQFLDGYVLCLARPYRTIAAGTRQVSLQAALLALVMLLMAAGLAWAAARLLLAPIAELQKGLLALRGRDFTVQVQHGQIEELAVMTERFNMIMGGLEELKTARAVQEALWPQEGLAGTGWRIAGSCRTATNLGGDHHDWFLLPDGRVVLAIGDVAGHGIAAALVGASAKTLLALTAPGGDPAAILSGINQGFLDQAGRSKPMSMWLGIFDPERRHLRYSCAGHNYPLAWLANGKYLAVGAPGYPLGSRKNAAFKSGELDLRVGGRLYLYTDGLIEAHDSGGEPFGYDRFAELTREILPLPPDEAIRLVFSRAEAWAGRAVPEDDQTLVLLDLAGEP